MKFLYNDIEQVLKWTENEIPNLVIENKTMFNTVIRDLHNQIVEGYDGVARLLDDNDSSIMKESVLIVDPFSISLENREILNFLSNYLLDKMKETYADLDNKLRPILNFIKETYLDLSLDIEVGEVFNQKSLAKVFPVSVYDESDLLIDRVTSYTKVMTDFNISRFFIFVNLKHYLEENDYITLISHIMNEKINVLFIEDRVHLCVEQEKYLIIDNDLCLIS